MSQVFWAFNLLRSSTHTKSKELLLECQIGPAFRVSPGKPPYYPFSFLLQSFTSDVAGLLGVQPSQILYTNVQQGSILLDTNVVSLSGATLDNATVTRISGVLQQGQPLNLSESQYGQVLVTSVGLPAQLTSELKT
jgi:hypothetical protein